MLTAFLLGSLIESKPVALKRNFNR